MKNRSGRRRIWVDILSIVFFAFGVTIFVSLATYSSLDPCLSNSVKATKYYNYLGKLGANIADIFFSFFGYLSFVFPVLFVYFAYILLFRRFERVFTFKSLGYLGLFITLSGLVTIFVPVSEGLSRYRRSGGVVGGIVASRLKDYLGGFGSPFILIVLTVIFLVLTFRLSLSSMGESLIYFFSTVYEWLRKIIVSLYSFLHIRYIEYRERHKRRIERLKEEEKKEEIKRVLMRSKEPEFVKEITKLSGKRKLSSKDAQLPLMHQEGGYTLPPFSLLSVDERTKEKMDTKSIELSIQILEKKLRDFGIEGRVTGFQSGPVVTVYEYEPAAGVKINQIVNLSDDLALALRAQSIRVLAPIPGKSVVGIEIPNINREIVYLKEIVSGKHFQDSGSKLTLALGKDVTGEPVVADLESMPHLLIAGATGSGKSVCLHSLISSILFKATPEEVKFVMIDPKMLELPVYDGLPHLMHEVVVDVKDAAKVLKWAVRHMEERYEKLKESGTKNVISYREQGGKDMPIIVIAIDELADLMMVVGKDVEDSIGRLAQKARAAGIHLIVATQRPSVDIITGTIKANFPARIAFKVPSKTDSRTILDANGAEALLGKGDMLLMLPNEPGLKRVHGALISEVEVKNIVEFWKSQGEPEYDSSILSREEIVTGEIDRIDEDDEMYPEAVIIVKEAEYASISYIQRRLRIGYNRAARLMERMEKEGVVKRVGNNKWELASVTSGNDNEK